jgi:hypothetical protein
MKPTILFAAAFAFCVLSIAPLQARAELSDELLDSTHDMRAQADMKQEAIPLWDNQGSDSLAVISGGNPFSQQGTVEDNSPDLDLGIDQNYATLEDVEEVQ